MLGALATVCLVGTSGCGNFFYAIYASGARAKLETAEKLGAQKCAPYEFHYAKEHLQTAIE